MPQAVTGGFPDDLVIGDGYTMQWAALDPTTGNAVAGVKVSNANIDADDVSASAGGGTTLFEVGPYMLIPGPGA